MQVVGNTVVIKPAPVNNNPGDRTTAAVAGNALSGGLAEVDRQQPGSVEGSLADLLKQDEVVNFQLNFSIDRESKELVVRVVNPVTNEVIRQIPPQEILNLAANLQQMAGVLIDRRA